MNRRQLLKGGLAGGAVIAGGLLAADRIERDVPPRPPETPAPPDEPKETPAEPGIRFEDEYGTVVDVVEAGADPEGGEPINAVLEAEAGDDTLLAFPGGTYQLQPMQLRGYSHLALAAAGEERATIVPEPGVCIGGPYVRFEGVSDFLLDRVDFDFREPNSGGEVRIYADGDATVRDVWAGGSCADQIALFRLDVRDQGATGVVENFRAENSNDDTSLTCVYVGKPHAGELNFRNCELSGFSDNGLYASAPGQEDGRNGTVHVEGGSYVNNNLANVRLGSSGSSARGVEIVNDTTPDADSVNIRGIRLRERGGQLIDDCDVHIGENAGASFGGIVFHPANTGAVIRNTSIQVDRDLVPAIRAFPRQEGATEQVFENLTITGSASREFGALIDERDGAVFRNCTIEQTGERRGGIRLAYSTNCLIEGCTIDVTAEPLVLRQSTAEIVDTTLRGPEGERYIEHMNAEDEDFRPR